MRATAVPFPITFDSRRKKIQRFLSLPQLTIENIWFAIVQSWLKIDVEPQQILYLAIDRTFWECINLLMISLIWSKRAFPIDLSKNYQSLFITEFCADWVILTVCCPIRSQLEADEAESENCFASIYYN